MTTWIPPPLVEGSVDKSAAHNLPKHLAPTVAAPESSELPPQWRDEKPIQCIAGRGPLDDATATILAQLLEKHGLGAEVVPHEAVSRNAIGEFKREGVKMVCVCYLDMTVHTPPLRFLLKRLRQRVGDARILVALWPADHPVMSDEKVRTALGADEYVTSLRDAVNACLKATHDAAATYSGGPITPAGNELPQVSVPPEILIPDGVRAQTREQDELDINYRCCLWPKRFPVADHGRQPEFGQALLAGRYGSARQRLRRQRRSVDRGNVAWRAVLSLLQRNITAASPGSSRDHQDSTECFHAR